MAQDPYYFFGSTKTGVLARSQEWSTHSLGPVEQWPYSLKTAISIVLQSKFPMFIAWGPERYFFYNDSYAEILGKKHPGAFGQKFKTVWSEIWNDLKPLIQSVDKGEGVYLENLKLIMNRKGFEEETYFTFSYSPIFSEQGSVDALFCTCVETTAEVIGKRELMKSEKRLRLALESADMGVWEIYLSNPPLTNLSDEFRRIFGMDPNKKLVHEVIEGWIHPEDRHRVQDTLSRAIAEKIPYVDEYRIVRKGGEVRWIHSRGLAQYDEKGTPSMLSGIVMDITNRKASEEELREALVSRDEFLSIASHELKTPLTSMKIQTQLQKRLSSSQAPDAYSKERIDQNTERFELLINRLDRLVEDMLDISRIRTGKMTIKKSEHDLVQVVREVIARTDQKQLVHLKSPDSVRANFDLMRIEQVLNNLLQNALKYAPGTEIEVSLSDLETTVRVAVRDQGQGISKENQSRIFDRFERAISASEISGLGLGLFISQQIVQSHKGRIWVESEPAKGATFIFEIPKT